MKKSALCLSLCLLLALFAGCQNRGAALGADGVAVPLRSTASYQIQQVDLAHISPLPEKIVFSGEVLYHMEKGEAPDARSIYATDLDTGKTQALAHYPHAPREDATEAESVELLGFFAGNSGSCWLLEQWTELVAAPTQGEEPEAPQPRASDMTESSEPQRLLQISYRLRLATAEGLSPLNLLLTEPLNGFTCGLTLKDAILISTKDQLFSFSLTGETLSSYWLSFTPMALTAYRSGAAVVTVGDHGRIKLLPFDAVSLTAEQGVSLPFAATALSDHSRFGLTLSGSGTALFYPCQQSLFACDGATAQVQKLVDWLDYNVNPVRILCQTVLPDGSVRALHQADDGTLSALCLHLEGAAATQKSSLTLAMLSADKAAMELAITFNRTHPDARIRVVNYGEYAAFGLSAQAMLTRQIADGNAPDMLFSSNRDLPVTELAQGYLEDLNPYLQADTQLQQEGLMESVLQVQTVEGKLLSIAPNFVLSTAISTTNMVGTGSMTVTRAINLFALYNTENGTVQEQFLKQETVLREHIARNSLLYGVDHTQELSFNNPSYQEGLLYTRQYPRTIDLDQYGDGLQPSWAQVRSGSQLFLSGTYYGFSALSQDLYAVGEGAILCGYPDVKGGHVLELWETYGMLTTCQDKALAWEFLRTALLAQSQTFAAGLGFPANLTAFRAAGEAAQQAEGSKDLPFGNIALTIPLKLSQSQYDAILACAKSAEARYHSDHELFAALWQEAQKYLSGQQDLSTTAANSQTAAENYRKPTYENSK